ncbi:hypothetical protein AALB39_01140 [Lachnospiraceae bacterium 54-53]
MKQYIVDAFTNKVFGGNLAAVCIPDRTAYILNHANDSPLPSLINDVKIQVFWRCILPHTQYAGRSCPGKSSFHNAELMILYSKRVR